LTALVESLDESISDIEMKTETGQRLAGTKQYSVEQRLPSFISHPNGILLHVLKKSYIFALSKTKKVSRSSFICHPNGIVVKVLNQK